jgi:hypothetical protein
MNYRGLKTAVHLTAVNFKYLQVIPAPAGKGVWTGVVLKGTGTV